MKEGDEYCGLDCSLLLEQLDEILQPIIEHADYDPVFAPKMIQKLIDKCEEVKSNLMYEALNRRYASAARAGA